MDEFRMKSLRLSTGISPTDNLPTDILPTSILPTGILPTDLKICSIKKSTGNFFTEQAQFVMPHKTVLTTFLSVVNCD